MSLLRPGVIKQHKPNHSSTRWLLTFNPICSKIQLAWALIMILINKSLHNTVGKNKFSRFGARAMTDRETDRQSDRYPCKLKHCCLHSHAVVHIHLTRGIQHVEIQSNLMFVVHAILVRLWPPLSSKGHLQYTGITISHEYARKDWSVTKHISFCWFPHIALVDTPVTLSLWVVKAALLQLCDSWSTLMTPWSVWWLSG